MNDLDRWSINETLLQSYRSIFISSQSFLLAVGALVAGRGGFLLLTTAFVGLVMIWWIWVPVVHARHRIVDYYKYRSLADDARRQEVCTEHAYVNDASQRATTNALLGITTNWRPTRLKIDLATPVLFSAVWLALIVHGWL